MTDHPTARPPFDPDFGKSGFALHLFRLRFRRLRLSQRAFSERFGLGYSTIRDAEQGARATAALRLIVTAIARDPTGMALNAQLAGHQCRCRESGSDEHCIDPAHTGGL